MSHKNFDKKCYSGCITSNLLGGSVQFHYLRQDVVGRMTFEDYLDQCDIGWDQAFHGRVSKKWNWCATMAYAKEKHHAHG